MKCTDLVHCSIEGSRPSMLFALRLLWQKLDGIWISYTGLFHWRDRGAYV